MTIDSSGPHVTLTPRAVVAILNFNGRAHLEYSMPTVLAQDYEPLRVVVVDNASTDDSVAWLAANQPRAHVLRIESNRGYAALNDVCDDPALGPFDYLMLMTNDVKLDARCVRHAVELMERDRGIGVVGFQMIGALRWVDPAELDKASARLGEVAVEDAGWVGGAAMVCRASLFEALGRIDEGYFAYCDEDDLQARVRLAGFRVVAINTPVWHNAGRNTFGAIRERPAFLQMRNTIRYQWKNYGLLRGIRSIGTVVAWACSPFRTADREVPYEVRHRPYSPLRNAPIVLRAVGWNVAHARETWAARKESLGRTARAARLLRPQGGT